MSVLPTEEWLAKTIGQTSSQFVLQNGTLYWVESDSTLQVIPPTRFCEHLFQQAYVGVFGAHLGDAKVHSELRKHYWWSGMHADISCWTKGCLVCATHATRRVVQPPLTPISVAGPFDRVGVDIVQLPRSWRGNQYAVVFIDYLTKWPDVFPVSDQSAFTIYSQSAGWGNC